MKTLLSFTLVAMLLISLPSIAQEQYTINGQQYSLKTEIEGPITLLWNVIDGEYRYFAKKGDKIFELQNYRVSGYKDEYITTLRELTSDLNMDPSKVNLTRPSLKAFFVRYNKRKDPNYNYETATIQLSTRLGAFGGVSNSSFTENPTNALQPVFGVDFELLDEVRLKRHSFVLRYKQTLETSDYAFSSSQVSLNYRFKFVKTAKFDAFINGKFVAYTHTSSEIIVQIPNTTGPGTTPMVQKVSGGSLQAPATFGLGADYALGNGYITFSYNDIVGLGVDSNGEFPIDFTLGYKFNL